MLDCVATEKRMKIKLVSFLCCDCFSSYATYSASLGHCVPWEPASDGMLGTLRSSPAASPRSALALSRVAFPVHPFSTARHSDVSYFPSEIRDSVTTTTTTTTTAAHGTELIGYVRQGHSKLKSK